ncbi:MAG: hypothetical protein ACFNPZ_05260, partial [Fusobacterium polymorphum]
LTATAVNFLWTPVFSYGLGLLFFRENIDMQLGLMMLLVTPCTDWYLVFTAQARGNTVLGASILPLNLALQILLLPVDLALFYGDAIRITDAEVVRSALIVLLLPLGLAACSNALGCISPLMARSIAHLRTWGDTLQLGFLMTAVLAMFASESAVLFAHPKLFADMLLYLSKILKFLLLSLMLKLQLIYKLDQISHHYILRKLHHILLLPHLLKLSLHYIFYQSMIPKLSM